MKSGPPAFNLSLYLVTDPVLHRGRSVTEIVERACQSGVTMVQYRDKKCSDSEYIELGRQLLKITRRYCVPLLLNDRVPVVKRIGAAGIHLGQEDLTLPEARSLLGDSAIIGVSTSSVAQAIKAARQGADYIAVSGVFFTDTKTDLKNQLGLNGVREISRAVTIPKVAIGGIKPVNAASVIQAGADGVAVVTAITLAPDIETAVKTLLKAVQAGFSLRENAGRDY